MALMQKKSSSIAIFSNQILNTLFLFRFFLFCASFLQDNPPRRLMLSVYRVGGLPLDHLPFRCIIDFSCFGNMLPQFFNISLQNFTISWNFSVFHEVLCMINLVVCNFWDLFRDYIFNGCDVFTIFYCV